MSAVAAYPRDMTGYGRNPPDPQWPGGAKLCVQFVINYEEGGENNILHGDAASEAFLSEIPGAQPWANARHWNMESVYEYGARAGFWRLWRLFTSRQIPVTVYGVATALMRAPEQVAAMQEAGWEIASHGLKWVDYRDMPRGVEESDLRQAIALHTEITGSPPAGYYLGRCSMNTRDLVIAQNCFTYSSDSYADDLPYWVPTNTTPHLVIPYTLDTNDMRFATSPGFTNSDDFFTYLRDSTDYLLHEGRTGTPKMLNIGLHCRLAGRPGRATALARYIDYLATHPDIWITRRIDIAHHWHTTHPCTSEAA
jgi:putative urate catabolism protein